MVLADLGSRISGALGKLFNRDVVDTAAFEELLLELQRALLEAGEAAAEDMRHSHTLARTPRTSLSPLLSPFFSVEWPHTRVSESESLYSFIIIISICHL